MGYDITNNDSTIELVPANLTPDPGNDPAIVLPSTLPKVELVGQEAISPIGEVINLPSVLPSPELIAAEGVTPAGQTINLPNTLLPDPIVLIEENIIPTTNNSRTFGGDKYYIHTQLQSANTWEVYHNLEKHPSIHIEDPNGNEMIAQLIHVDKNHARILFGRIYSGTAYCN